MLTQMGDERKKYTDPKGTPKKKKKKNNLQQLWNNNVLIYDAENHDRIDMRDL